MIKVKHLMDATETDDGLRIYVEPTALTRDLIEWCAVDHAMLNLAPPTHLARWFDEHTDGYDYFRGKYHDHLAHSSHGQILRVMARTAMSENITLLHTGGDPNLNTAAALHEFLSELQAHTSPE
jgi:uncharacterized protein YeaO (DUF488 family)